MNWWSFHILRLCTTLNGGRNIIRIIRETWSSLQSLCSYKVYEMGMGQVEKRRKNLPVVETSQSALQDAHRSFEASGKMLSDADATPDRRRKKNQQTNGLYKWLTEAARRGFFFFNKSDSRGLILQPETVPVAIGDIGPVRAKRLKFLGLSRCQLRLLPEFVSGLVRLESLQLQHNHLKTLPDWIGNLTQLKYLDVSGNLLKHLPDGLGKCRSLLEFDANLNQLESLPCTLGRLEKLEKLHVHINNLKSLPPSCSNLKSLRYVDLRFNKLQELPKCIGDLQPLDFQGCDMDGLPEFIDLSFSEKSSDLQTESPAFSAEITIYNYLSNSEQGKDLSKCFEGQLTNMSMILLLDGNPVSVPPIKTMYITGCATLERYTQQDLVDSDPRK
ncbi:hypothetical protein MPTK2_7g02480 [Marchantia polymorpha subsp. ruderalis]